MRHLLATAIALALTSAPTLVRADGTPGTPDQETQTVLATTQLPRLVRPTHYDVAITPHAQAMNFDGKVQVTIEVLESTDQIVLNAVDLAFSKVTLGTADGKSPLLPAKVVVDAGEQTALFGFSRKIAPGTYLLTMDYTGKIGTQANGIFAIDYETQAGPRRALYTQFENSDARRLIPSWDEPAYKATFALQATVPSAQMAVSNMPVAERTELGKGLARVRFAPTPKMSTYLLFFGLGDFERATARAGVTEVGVVTQRGKLAQAQFALDASKVILAEYNDYFATPYPLPKLDNIASPGSSQFFGAMENWGAIYTFESAMLLDPSISTESDKHRIFEIAAHEIAHQWFGNLVTMQWWDDLWLNEGFASWMEGRTTERLHPEWNSALSAVGERERAMQRDAVATTHPVVQHVETVEQAAQAFDRITYDKGQVVIGMLEGYVGADAWRTGVRNYMKAHAYGNTVTDDFWRAVEQAAGKPITAIAHDFTLQPGVPLIRVDAATCSNGRTTLSLTQDEFTTDRPGKTPLRWHVPVIAALATARTSDAQVRTLVSEGKATLEVPGCGPVVVNAGQSGYYRTLYAPALFAGLKRDFATLAPIDQLGVMTDTWSMGLAGLQPASDFLDLAAATPLDADSQVWGKISETFGGIDGSYAGAPERQAVFRKFAIARLAPVLAKLGWTPRAGEADTVAILRGEVIGTLGNLGDPAVVAEARRRFAAQAGDPQAMPGALRKVILGVVARHADVATWDQLHAMALAEKTPLVKDQLYKLLAAPADETLARRALALALTPEPGATNTAAMINGVADLHPDLAFDFAIEHMAAVDERVDVTSRSSYYPGLAGRSADAAMIGKITSYAANHLAPGSRRGAETAVANIEYRIKVRNLRLPAIDAWLQQHAVGP